MAALFGLYIIGLLHLPNWQEAGLELKGKLPILGFALIVGSLPKLNFDQFRLLMRWFKAAVLSGILCGVYFYIIQDFTDPRELVLFVSPVRFALMLNLSIFSAAFFLYRDKNSRRIKLFYIVILISCFGFMLIIESIIGILIFSLVSAIIAIRALIKIKKLYIRLTILGMLIFVPSYVFLNITEHIYNYYNIDEVEFSKLDQATINGEFYVHDTINFEIEDGSYSGLFIAYKELKNAWFKETGQLLSNTDGKSQPVLKTLVRYMNSKGLRKDSVGFLNLSEHDVRNIQFGIANINYVDNPGLKTRVSRILFGYEVYKKTKNPNGNSVFQRIEYWTNTWNIFKRNMILGVGYTNLPEAFEQEYKATQTKLSKENQMETHNQYLLVLAGFGIIGLLIFCYLIFSPIFKTENQHYHYLIFIAIIAFSMFTEDTLQTQVGVTFFAFFNALFLFGYNQKSCN